MIKPDFKKVWFYLYQIILYEYTDTYHKRGSIMNEFIKLLELEYKELKVSIEKTSLEGKGTPQEIADRREELFHSFFEKYFPFPFRITKGNIIDSFGKRSASIDCIILDPSHPYTIDPKNKKASVIFADGVDYAVEIKGALCDKEEIARALNQIKTVKDLTRVRNGLIWDKDKNEYTYKISTIIYAEKTYSKIDTLIETILDYYKKNKIKRLYQFDILVAGDYIIINLCKGQISFKSNQRGFVFAKTGDKTLAMLLHLMTKMPLVQPRINEDIYDIYLNRIPIKLFYYNNSNAILEEIERS